MILKIFKKPVKSNLIPFLIGICISLIVSLDPFITNYLHIGYLKHIPYSFTILVLISTICLYLIHINLEKVWKRVIPILLVSLIISDQIKGLIPIAVDPADIVVLSAFIIWLVKNLMNEDSRVRWSKFDLLILGLILLAFLSMINAGQIPYVRLAKGLRCFAVAFIVAKLITTKDNLYLFIKSLIIIISISAILGILQEILFVQTGIIFPPLPQRFNAINIENMMLRISALAGVTQDFANTLTITLTIILFILLFPTVRDLKKSIFLLIAFLLIAIALYLTNTKPTWLAFIITALIGLFLKRPSYSIHFIMGLSFLSILSYFTGILAKITDLFYSEVSLMGDIAYRTEMIKLAIEASLARHPFIGIGIERSNIYIANPYFWPPHNTFVQIFAEIGIIGFIIYLSMLLYLIIRMLTVILIVKRGDDKTIAISLLMGLFSLIIYGQSDPTFLRLFPWIYFGLVESAILILGGEQSHPKSDLVGYGSQKNLASCNYKDVRLK
ncbi:MAG: O-antigen ligase family protein [Nitrospinae bacterium]|nr:O-antigen ligase family protein [Nitrospinota bacterium]